MNSIAPSYPSSFIQYTAEMGCFYLGSRIRDDARYGADKLLTGVKTATRYLKSACRISHSKALEAISVAGGFQHWHELSQHLDKAHHFENNTPDSAWVERFCGLSPLLINIEGDEELNTYAMNEIVRFSEALATRLNCLPEVILNGVFARFCHADEWPEVLARHPLKATDPYYWFVTGKPYDSPHFLSSDACIRLYDYIEDGLDVSNIDDLNTFVDRLNQATQIRPDYLEGWLRLSSIYLEPHPDLALTYADIGVGVAESLLPKGFKSKLEWSYHDNRHYLRLLEIKMLAHEALLEDDPKGIVHAIKCAKRLARISPAQKEFALEKLEEYLEIKDELDSQSKLQR